MLRFVARRVLQMIPLLIGITFLSFVVVDLAPGDFFSALRLNPLLVRYGRWVWRLLHLDFCMSIAYLVAVLDLIGARALNTLILAVASMVFTWALAIPIGTVVALWRGSVTDRALSFLAFLGMSVPAGRRRSTTRCSARSTASPTGRRTSCSP
jgi:peptide/nickel transport system permease protein